ncbi:MAG: transcriptional repressor LexA [Planctomycetes bacterium]|nr:transcriptional repressor LexA [Planctomycetota bacterium]
MPTPEKLSSRQEAALRSLRAFQARHGYPPTRAELGRLLGVSAQTADFHLRALERKGLIQISRQARGIEPTPAGEALAAAEQGVTARAVPIVGRVAAGAPLTAIQNLEGALPLPEGSSADFALRVEGDSMIEAGILDGDLVLVEQTDSAKKGDIVVALVGEGEEMEATVKRYLPERGRIVLRPANATLSDIVVRRGEPFSLAGRVVGVLRLWK